MKIEGMMCPHCEARVKKCLEEIAEVKEAVVSHKDGTATVTSDGKLDRQILVDAITAQGYTVIG